MNPMTQLLAQQRINDLHSYAARAQVARQAKATRRRHRQLETATGR